LRNGLYGFGVAVQAYMDIAALNLFKIDKCSNRIYIGCDHYNAPYYPENYFSSNTYIAGNLYINNPNGINITTYGNVLRFKVNTKDFSFENDFYQNKNIVLSRGF
jgi:hypothetical protein